MAFSVAAKEKDSDGEEEKEKKKKEKKEGKDQKPSKKEEKKSAGEALKCSYCAEATDFKQNLNLHTNTSLSFLKMPLQDIH